MRIGCGDAGLQRLLRAGPPSRGSSGASDSRRLVRTGGVEPPRPFGHRILSPVRLPVPPRSPVRARETQPRARASPVGPGRAGQSGSVASAPRGGQTPRAAAGVAGQPAHTIPTMPSGEPVGPPAVAQGYDQRAADFSAQRRRSMRGRAAGLRVRLVLAACAGRSRSSGSATAAASTGAVLALGRLRPRLRAGRRARMRASTSAPGAPPRWHLNADAAARLRRDGRAVRGLVCAEGTRTAARIPSPPISTWRPRVALRLLGRARRTPETAPGGWLLVPATGPTRSPCDSRRRARWRRRWTRGSDSRPRAIATRTMRDHEVDRFLAWCEGEPGCGGGRGSTPLASLVGWPTPVLIALAVAGSPRTAGSSGPLPAAAVARRAAAARARVRGRLVASGAAGLARHVRPGGDRSGASAPRPAACRPACRARRGRRCAPRRARPASRVREPAAHARPALADSHGHHVGRPRVVGPRGVAAAARPPRARLARGRGHGGGRLGAGRPRPRPSRVGVAPGRAASARRARGLGNGRIR